MKKTWDKDFIVKSYDDLARGIRDPDGYLACFGKLVGELFERVNLADYHVTTSHAVLCVNRFATDSAAIPRVTLKLDPELMPSLIKVGVECMTRQGEVINVFSHYRLIPRAVFFSELDGILADFNELRNNQARLFKLGFT